MNIAPLNVGSAQSYPVNLEKAPASSPEQEQAAVSGDSVSIGSEDSSAEKTKKKWTVLLYSAADNNLETSLVSDVAELESVGSNDEINMVVQLDRGEKPSELSGGWAGCKRFYLNKDSDKMNINSESLADLGQVNMSSADTLSDFIQWGMKEFPAENYILIMSDHGAGWTGALQDLSHKDFASTPEIKKGIQDAEEKTGQKLNVIGFDACLMASTEVAHELAPLADYLVVSQNTEGGDGWPYSKIFTEKKHFFSSPKTISGDITPDGLASKIVKESKKAFSISTLSSIDLSKMPGVTEATDNFAEVLMNSPADKEAVKKAASETKQWYGFRDQYDFASVIVHSEEIQNPDLKKAAFEMQKALKDAVVAEQHSFLQLGAHGLSLEISPEGVAKNGYSDLQFAKDTKWDEAMTWLGVQS